MKLVLQMLAKLQTDSVAATQKHSTNGVKKYDWDDAHRNYMQVSS